MNMTSNIIPAFAITIYRKWVLPVQVSIEAFAAYVEHRADKSSLPLFTTNPELSKIFSLAACVEPIAFECSLPLPM